MTLEEAIKARHSVRQYLDKPTMVGLPALNTKAGGDFSKDRQDPMR